MPYCRRAPAGNSEVCVAIRVLFYVQHLLGIGHLARASQIAAALAESGANVTIVTGGRPVQGFPPAGIGTIQLQPLSAGPAGFSQLIDNDGQPASDALRKDRKDRLLAAFDACRPDVLLVEAFPFGRRQMRFELIPLLAAAHQRPRRPLVACSVRDILQHRAMQRHRETLDMVQRYFDCVLVHGDPRFAALGETFPLADEIASAVEYTGIVSSPPGRLQGQGHDVVVSAGGGIAGARMMQCAIAARQLSSLKDASWCFLVGPNHPADSVQLLKSSAARGVTICEIRPDFRALLHSARLSISQAGYNTVADILRAGCRALLVPFAEGGESEQSLRAQKLHRLGVANILAEGALSPARMAAAIDETMQSQKVELTGLIDTNGAECTARLLLERAAGKATP